MTPETFERLENQLKYSPNEYHQYHYGTTGTIPMCVNAFIKDMYKLGQLILVQREVSRDNNRVAIYEYLVARYEA